MGRSGIYKSEVLRARDTLLASGRYPSIDAVREALGHTGSKGTIHRYLKEIEEEEGPATGSRVAVSEAIQDLVGRLAARVNGEAQERITAAQAQHAAQIGQHEQAAATLKAEALLARQQLEHTQRLLTSEKAGHSKAQEALSQKTLACTQLTQQVLDLQERLAAEERHRQSLEEKHQHARQALEHFRQSSKEQREQDQRKHEQQLQYLQAELRSVNAVLADKRQEAVQALQENARLLGDMSRAQNDLHSAQEELRSLRPLKEALAFEQRRTEALGQRLVAQEAALAQLSTDKDRLQAWGDGLLAEQQQLALALATAKASVVAQENMVARVLDRFVAARAADTLSEGVVKPTVAEAAVETPTKTDPGLAQGRQDPAAGHAA